MRLGLLALLAFASTSAPGHPPRPAPRRPAAPDAPLAGAPDLAPAPPDVLDLLGRCRAELPALGCSVDASGHGGCDAAAHGRFVELDLCDASGALAVGGADGHVCGVRWRDCLFCLTTHALVLPWRAGRWPPDVSDAAAWRRRAAACQDTARSSDVPQSST